MFLLVAPPIIDLCVMRLSCQENDGHIQATIVPGEEVLVQAPGLPPSSSSQPPPSSHPPAANVHMDDSQGSSSSYFPGVMDCPEQVAWAAKVAEQDDVVRRFRASRKGPEKLVPLLARPKS